VKASLLVTLTVSKAKTVAESARPSLTAPVRVIGPA
jgi:hypothetical protein